MLTSQSEHKYLSVQSLNKFQNLKQHEKVLINFPKVNILPFCGLESFLLNYLFFQLISNIFHFSSAVYSSESSGIIPTVVFSVDFKSWEQEEERGIFN